MDSETELTDIAVELVRAVMRSASTDNIRPIDWWPRARAALETGAAVADGWGHMISRMGRKVQVEAFTLASAHAIAELEARLGNAFVAFRDLCQRDALFIVAMAQARNQETSQ